MKIKIVHIGLAVALCLMFSVWLSARLRQEKVARDLAEPLPAARTAPGAGAANPQAQAYLDRQTFERSLRAFLRDAETMSPEKRLVAARALAEEVGRRERNGEFSADEVVMLRIGLIQAGVEDSAQRVRQAQEVVDHYRAQSEARRLAFEQKQLRDAQFQRYKAWENRIVSEVLAMNAYPGGMGRDEYLRLRLQEARETIYGAGGAPRPVSPVPLEPPPAPTP